MWPKACHFILHEIGVISAPWELSHASMRSNNLRGKVAVAAAGCFYCNYQWSFFEQLYGRY